ncbi:MAG: NAD(P)-dependent oxidoreductase [Thiothrix sp.]
METLQGKTLFITGGSRGIGQAIALKAANEGANIVIAAKTTEPHPRLPGTIYTAAAEVEAAGGKALPLPVDIRDETQIAAAVEQAVATFGSIDILINNASAISLTGTLDTPMKRYDLMQQVNARGTFAVSQACLPHLLKAPNPHILTLSPPLDMQPKWFSPHLAYTMAKYGMSMCVLGMAEEFRNKVAVNALWPRTVILTAAIQMLGGIVKPEMCRKPEIVADAASFILKQDAKQHTGNFYIDEEVLATAGVKDFEQYAVSPDAPLLTDLFLEDAHMRP